MTDDPKRGSRLSRHGIPVCVLHHAVTLCQLPSCAQRGIPPNHVALGIFGSATDHGTPKKPGTKIYQDPPKTLSRVAIAPLD